MTRNDILEKYQSQRRRPMVYTRVMGYHRPIESFNKGKLGEHQQRCYFDETSLRYHPLHNG